MQKDTKFVAVILGASGLTGSALVSQLLQDDNFSELHILVRKKLELHGPGIYQHVVDLENTAQLEAVIPPEAILFSCIGTTQKKVKGDKAAYRSIDLDIPLRTARIVKAKGGKQMVLLSSVGASASSRNFYLALKGEVEEKIAALHFDCLHIYRPSILVGDRKEKRLGESIGKWVMQAFSFLLMGSWQNYRPANVTAIATSMRKVIKEHRNGIHYYYWKDFN